jgi:hypothetical protein
MVKGNKIPVALGKVLYSHELTRNEIYRKDVPRED